jgi:hypothetical protein
MQGFVTGASEVSFAVGYVFEYRGNRVLFGAFRFPDAGRKPRPVGQGNPHVLHGAHAMWKRVDGFHARSARFIEEEILALSRGSEYDGIVPCDRRGADFDEYETPLENCIRGLPRASIDKAGDQNCARTSTAR